MIGLICTILAFYCYIHLSTRYISVLLVFASITCIFQLAPYELMILNKIGISKPYDWGFVFCILVFLAKPKIFFNAYLWKEFAVIKYFALLLIFLLGYNILYVGVEVGVCLRVFRNYLFFLLIFPFSILSIKDFEKILRSIVYFTSFASFLYCLQPFVGQALLGGMASEALAKEGDGIARYYNLPFYLVPITFIFFFPKQAFNLKFNKVLLGVNFMAILLSQHRNMMLAIVCCLFVYLFISKRLKISYLFIYSIIGAGLFITIDSFLNNRFSQGFEELSKSSTGVSSFNRSINIAELSTSEFRWLHLLERFQYIQQDMAKFLFGIGFLTEDSALAKKLSFNIGLYNEFGEIVQVDTSDIAWSVLVVQFGIIGIIVFITFYGAFLKKYFPFKNNKILTLAILYIISLLMTSFFGNGILMPYSTCLLMLFAAYFYQYKRYYLKKLALYKVSSSNYRIKSISTSSIER